MRGSILVEAVLALSFVVIPALALQLEIARVVLNRALLHASVFHFVRHRGLGSSKRTALLATRPLTNRLLKWERRQARAFEHWEEGQYPSRRELWAKVQVRYLTWFPWVQNQMQVTESCRFFW